MTHTRHERAAGAGRRCVSYVTLGRGDFEPTAALGKGHATGRNRQSSNVLLDLRSLRTGRRAERERKRRNAEKLTRK